MFGFRADESTMGFKMVNCSFFLPNLTDPFSRPLLCLLVTWVSIGSGTTRPSTRSLAPVNLLPLLPLEDADPGRVGGDRIPELPLHVIHHRELEISTSSSTGFESLFLRGQDVPFPALFRSPYRENMSDCGRIQSLRTQTGPAVTAAPPIRGLSRILG